MPGGCGLSRNSDLLAEAAEMIKGVRNYSAFGAPTRPGGHTIREVINASLAADEDGLIFEITANAFLYHMVRRVTFIHVRIGQGLDIHSGLPGRRLNTVRLYRQGWQPPRG